MPAVIPVYFDYASSLCAIAAVIGTQLEAELDIVLDWRPVEIAAQHPDWKSGGLIGGDTRAKIARVSAETGVSIEVPAHWLDSRAALEGAFCAQAHGRFREYHQRVFAAAFTDGRDIGDPTVLLSVATDAGIPAAVLSRELATGARTAQLAASLAEARRRGVLGYPTFFLGGFPLTGIQPIETMRLLIRRHLERQTEPVLH
jgi:predicted DsbA family dithiol-disulfide isomerase